MGEPAAPVARGLKAQRSLATRSALVAAARELFAKRGYAQVGTEEIVRAAGVTRGALYHHFKDKAELFAAVYEDVEESLMQQIAASAIAAAPDPLELLRAGASGFLDACEDPAVQQIALLDAPSVLGWEQWRAMDEGQTAGAMRDMLQAVADTGRLPQELVGPFAHMILAALDEAAMIVARAPDSRVAVAEERQAVEEFLARLLRP